MRITLYVVPVLIAVFSLVVIWASLQLERSPDMIVGDSMQPRAFPIFLMAVNLLLVVFLVLRLRKERPAPVPLEPFATWGSIALMVLFYALTTWLDMFIGIAVVMFGMCMLWGERRVLVAGAVALVTPISVFFLFDLVLRVRFPRGILVNWYYG